MGPIRMHPEPAADTPIGALKSLGPQSEAMLARAGITRFEELRALGAARAYVRARRVNPRVSLNLLWALESALSGERWQDVARTHRASLLLAVDALEAQATEAQSDPAAP